MDTPIMMTIRQVAATGIMSEHALRQLVRQGQAPCIYIGTRCYVNYQKLLEMLENLGDHI